MALFGFGNRRPPADQEARAAIVDWVRRCGGLEEAITVKASEIVCADPACPGIETVILILAPGLPTRALKVGRPLPDVTEADIAAAFAGEGTASRG
ncbi:hypothetical protein ASG51_07205 [Methylobacterium sp. Leaf465]|uniref:hypothetical protein n=1 Tax=Methylobacterium sp. Leaf465 TaxID=1736385 RepID=UPI0006F7CE15|nr:hypothetical protein [Methylobacterium sp. Leaf465]KQT76650.1 hypothetical protein ASG51_07205 [Methylobacterium sp. Leaf465]